MKKIVLSLAVALITATTASADDGKVYKEVNTGSLLSSEKRVYLVEDGKEYFVSSTTKEFSPVESLINLCSAQKGIMTGCAVEVSSGMQVSSSNSFNNSGDTTLITGMGPMDVTVNETSKTYENGGNTFSVGLSYAEKINLEVYGTQVSHLQIQSHQIANTLL